MGQTTNDTIDTAPGHATGIEVADRPAATAAYRPATRGRHTALSLVPLLGAMFLGNVDVAIANVAAPSIHAGLHASGGELELVVSGYTLAYAMLLVVSARLGETRGYRRTFLLGVGAFALTSLACGLAPTTLTLILARIAAGASAALMAAQVLTGIQLGFEGPARARAVGFYALALSAGAVAGQSLGGLLVSADLFGTTWRPAFLINVPVSAVLFLLAWRFLPAENPRRPQRLDLPGVATSSAALLLLVVPLVLGHDEGWPLWTWACLAASVPAFAVFVIAQRKLAARGGHPLVNVHLLARPSIAWGLICLAANSATYFAMLFTLALYLQQGLGTSPAYSGLALVSWVAAFGVPGLVLGRLPSRLRNLAGPGGSVILGAGFAAIAVSLFARDTSGLVLMTLLGVAGLGLGAAFAGLLGHLTSSVPPRYAPDISGMFSTITRVAGVIGVAAFGTAYFALVPHPAPGPAVHGFAIVNVAMAATAMASALAARLSVRSRPAPAAPR